MLALSMSSGSLDMLPDITISGSIGSILGNMRLCRGEDGGGGRKMEGERFWGREGGKEGRGG